jgi:glycosyltransferase involved in cell wall biosynthesis
VFFLYAWFADIIKVVISAIVLTKNEEQMIRTCLESLGWVDELIVYDNGSTDKTLEIVKRYTAKVFHYEGLDYQELRNKAMEKASGDWVLYVDADERILEPLKNELIEISQSSDKTAFALSRINVIFGQKVSYGPYKNDWMIRYFKKNKFRTWVGKIHEYATFDGELDYSQNSLLHLTHRDIDQVISKTLHWSNLYAQMLLDAHHPKMSSWRFFRIFFSESWEQGIKRRGFFNGDVGIIDSMLQVFSQFITYVKLWQLQQKKSLPEAYQEIDNKLRENNFKY